MSLPALSTRIRNGTLVMLLIALVVGAVELPQIYRLGGAIRETLYRNYLSIEAAQHMGTALDNLQLALRDGQVASALPSNRAVFEHWIGVELSDITEAGEGPLAEEIQQRGERLFGELSRPVPVVTSLDPRFAQLRVLLDRLIAINKSAMFRADSRASQLSQRVFTEFAAALLILLVLGVALSWTLAWSISKPLSELTDRLRSFSLRGPSLRLGEQKLAELQAVASEFNKMAERLEQFEKLNVNRLIYEKSKTEAIIESIEDGIVLIDPNGVVTHINEVAALILGVEREEALGSPIQDLSSSHPHYLRVRAALQSLSKHPIEAQRTEIDLHVRGRDHTYVLKPVALRQGPEQSFGTLLILQDITYLRDKDRARANLVATLSHELKTPLTSLGLSVELLERDRERFDPEDRKLVDAIGEDLDRMRHLADDLLDLAKGSAGAITIRTLKLDVTQLIASVVKTFALQAEQKGVSIVQRLEQDIPRVRADPVKLSWVISNLLANALRYTPGGGEITLDSMRTERAARILVRDSGPGVAPQVRDHLFERYTQWNIDGTQPGSAGLGLAIVKEIVEAHGGRIFVDSEPGKGTCFTVELPLDPEDLWPES